MSDNHDYLGVNTSRMRLTADVLILMLKGAGYALLFCLSIWAIYAIFWVAGILLPDDRNFMPDPVNRGWNDAQVVVIEPITRA